VNGELVVRAYSPVSSDDDVGYFELVIKVRRLLRCSGQRAKSDDVQANTKPPLHGRQMVDGLVAELGRPLYGEQHCCH
jgi:Oxidoreductase FAD-binding domain